MAISRGVLTGITLMAIGVAVAGAALAVATLRPGGSKPAETIRLHPLAAAGPKAVVDHLSRDLGVIESTAEMEHTFIIRNAGQAPLRLTRGPSSCACTVTKLPDQPVPPGGRADVTMAISESAKRDQLKPGPFSRDIHVLTNDPDHPDIALAVRGTVNRRVNVVPSPVTLALDSSKPLSPQERSFEAWVYSERWEGFELSVARASQPQMQWHIEPATAAKLKELQARHGYRVVVTLPPEMAEGHFAEWIKFAARGKGEEKCLANCLPVDWQQLKAGPGGPALLPGPVSGLAACRLEVQGRVNGRLTFYSPKLVDRNVLQLGTRPRGQRVHETLIMKVNDERHRLTAAHIETEPAFLRARLTPYASGPKEIGLYRLEVEIPGDAPSCAYTGEHRGVVRLRTDHPRLPVIELQVDFILAAGSEDPGHVATR
jgi:hypothetical protein